MRLIDADALKEKLFIDGDNWNPVVTEVEINEMPTIEAAPVVHGEWKFTSRLRNGRSAFSIRCSACDSSQGANWMNYCPNCGAKMAKRN